MWSRNSYSQPVRKYQAYRSKIYKPYSSSFLSGFLRTNQASVGLLCIIKNRINHWWVSDQRENSSTPRSNLWSELLNVKGPFDRRIVSGAIQHHYKSNKTWPGTPSFILSAQKGPSAIEKGENRWEKSRCQMFYENYPVIGYLMTSYERFSKNSRAIQISMKR